MKRYFSQLRKQLAFTRKSDGTRSGTPSAASLKANGEDVKTVQELVAAHEQSDHAGCLHAGGELEQAGGTEQGCKNDRAMWVRR
jgi:hypothetical protein